MKPNALTSKRLLWLLWVVSSLALAGFLGYELLVQPHKPNFLPGETSAGHYQIELTCSACHTESFTDEEAIQNACVDCHSEELKQARDSHPKSKFTDPRNADRLAKIDARYCAACHGEHTPAVTQVMGVTQPQDFCLHCHQDIAEDRPSHEGMEFETCASSGCHNYHDNQALYEDFLLEHAHGPDLKPEPDLPGSTLERILALGGVEWSAYQPGQPAFESTEARDAAHAEWALSSHGEAGVGCQNCHQPEASEPWQERPDTAVCGQCHQAEQTGFLAGKHGMRLAQGLDPMTPGQARQPMKAEAAHQELTCNSCHAPHRQDTVTAAAESCAGCHNDAHTLAFEGSPHHQTWLEFIDGERPRESAVSCATCHLPRLETRLRGETVWRVEHNQNATLRPNEKMIRATCMNCHSLAFSIDALASPELIETNFRGRPANHVPSIDMALNRDAPRSAPPERNQTGE